MRKLRLLLITALISTHIFGQETGFSITGGLGTYDLSDFKNYHEQMLDRMPVNVKAGDYFPPYSSIKMNLFRRHSEKIKYGILFGYSTTGAHANYSDYSGSINFDQVIAAYQLGLNGYYKLVNRPSFNISAYGDLKLSYIDDAVSILVLSRYVNRYSKLKFHTVSPFTEAGLEAIVRLKKLSLGVEGGYLYDFGAAMNTNSANSTEALVDLSPENELHSGMSGFRIGIKAIIMLFANL